MTHIVFGMVLPEAMEEAPDWVQFAGCVTFGNEPNRACENCGNNWIARSGPPADEPPTRRRTPAPLPRPRRHASREDRTAPSDPGETMVWTLRELLNATDCTTEDDLADRLFDEFDLDVYLEQADDISVEVRIGTQAIVFEYPFTVSEFWEGVTDLEDEVAAKSEGNDE